MSIALLIVIPGTLIALALIAWLVIATVGGMRGREPIETNPGDLLRRLDHLEERVARLEREKRGE